MTIRNFLSYTGIFTYPIFAWLFWYILEAFEMLGVVLPAYPVIRILVIYVLPIIFPIIVTTTNMERQKRGQTDFSFSEVYGLGNKDPKHSKEYIEAAYPDVPKEYSSKTPKDLVFGKHKGKYVICPIKKDGINIFCVGTPGSGKSVLLLSWLYSMIHREEIAKKGKTEAGKKYSFFLVDIKGELFERLLQIKGKDYDARKYQELKVVAPSNRQSYGYDVFYRIHKEHVSETEYIKAITDIVDALVMEAGNDSPYFSENAKKMLAGFLYYYSKQGDEFVTIIKRIMRTSLAKLLQEVLKGAMEQRMMFALDKLAMFAGKEGNESIQDVEATLQMYLSVFSYPDIEYCLKDNPNKTSPADLRDGKTCIDFAIEESMLTTYEPIFRLVCMQMLKECEEFKEDDDRYTCLIWDEAARVGRIKNLDAAMSTLRSKKVSLMVLFQSLSQFRDIYPSETAKTLLNLCEIKIFLSGGDKETADYVGAIAGDFEATKMSYKRKGFFGGKSDGNYSTERRPIVDTKEMMGLRERGEAIVFIYGHYCRCKKLRYFEDPYIAPILKRKQEEKTKAT